MQDGYNAIDDTLVSLLARAKPSQRRKAIRKALAYVRKQNQLRIRQQQNTDGTPYTPRKQSRLVGQTSVWIKGKDNDAYTGELLRTRGKDYITLRFYDGSAIRIKKTDIVKTGKVKAKKKKMLTGFAKMLQIRMFGAAKGVLSFKSGAVKLAREHHFGKLMKNGGHLPYRQLLGLSDLDKTMAINIMLESLSQPA